MPPTSTPSAWSPTNAWPGIRRSRPASRWRSRSRTSTSRCPRCRPDVPQPVSDLVYHMLAKTPEERPASVRVVADRADVLRDALALGESTPRSDIQRDQGGSVLQRDQGGSAAAATGVLPGREGPGSGRPRGAGSRRGRRRQLVAGASTAVLCAAAVATGLYLSGHSPARPAETRATARASELTHRHAVPQRPARTPGRRRVLVRWWCSRHDPPSPTAGNPRPTKSVKPTPSPKASPSASPSDVGEQFTDPDEFADGDCSTVTVNDVYAVFESERH